MATPSQINAFRKTGESLVSRTIRVLEWIESQLNARSIRGWNKIDGFISDREAYFLYSIARSLPEDAVCLEIGVWKGRSAYCIASGLSGRASLLAIDPFDASGELESRAVYKSRQGKLPLLEQFSDAMAIWGVSEKISVLKGYSRDFVDRVGELDLLFIDGDHSIDGAEYDYTHYANKLKKGGYLIFDDYDPARKDLGPTHVIETMVYPSLAFELVGVYGRLWVGKKRALDT